MSFWVTPHSARDVQVVGSMAFLVTYGAGLRVLSVSEKVRPRLIGGTGSGYALAVDDHLSICP